MPSLFVVTRQTNDGPRYVVRYRLGGRAYPVQHAGSFKTLKDAKARRDFVAREISAGRNPAEALRVLLDQPQALRMITLRGWTEKFLESRIDIDTNTKRNYRTALKKVGETFGDRDPASLTADDVAGWVAELAGNAQAWNSAALPAHVPAATRLRRLRSEPGP